jgi:hypothetical protein
MAADDWCPRDAPWDEDDCGIVCKYCGQGELEWEEARGERNEKRWVLVDYKGDIHNCRAIGPASIDEFEDER